MTGRCLLGLSWVSGDGRGRPVWRGCGGLREREAVRRKWARVASRRLRRAYGRPQLHERLVEIARALRRYERVSKCPEPFGGGGECGVVTDGTETCEDPHHIPVHRRGATVVPYRGDGTSRVFANPFHLAPTSDISGEDSVVLGDEGLRGLEEEAGAPVVSKTLPLLAHLVERSARQMAHCGPARHPLAVILFDSLDLSLLEHHFGDPDSVGALGGAGSCHAGRRLQPPRQRAVASIIPSEEVGANCREGHGGELLDVCGWLELLSTRLGTHRNRSALSDPVHGQVRERGEQDGEGRRDDEASARTFDR